LFCLPFFFWPLSCLSFDLRLLITEEEGQTKQWPEEGQTRQWPEEEGQTRQWPEGQARQWPEG
jgi:hypothetical protein